MDAEFAENNGGYGDIPDISQYLSINMDEGDSASLKLEEYDDDESLPPDSINGLTFCETTLTPVFPIKTAEQPNSTMSFSDIFSRFGPSNGKLCPFCNRYFSKTKFSAHLRTHTGEKPYICEYCNKAFARSDKLKTHRRVHTGEKPYGCFCGKRFARMDRMKMHATTHNVSPFKRDMMLGAIKYGGNNNMKGNLSKSDHSLGLQCPHCPAKFPGKYKLERHIRTHTGDKPYKCLCETRFTRLEHLKKHQAGKTCPLNSEDTSNEVENCSFNDKFSDVIAPNFQEPQPECSIKEENESIYMPFPLTETIDNNDSQFATGESSSNGYVVAIDGEEDKKPIKCCRIFICEFCDKIFTKGHKLNIHRRIHTGEKPYSCETCGKGFARKDHLLKHMNVHLKYRKATSDSMKSTLDHMDGSFLENSIFGMEIKQEIIDNLTDDSNIYQEISEDALATLFKPKERTRRKSVIKISENGSFRCSICPLVFTTEYYLQCHMQVHVNRTVFTCDVCLREFKVKKNYEAHLLNHEAQADILSISPELDDARSKRAQCPQCSKWLVSQSSLDMHMRSHTGEKPHQCDLCEKYFVRKADMVRHRKAHTGESMYNCPVCSASYTRRDKLSLHLKKNHSNVEVKEYLSEKS